MNNYQIPLRRKFLMYVEGGQPVPPPPPPPIVKWLDVTRTDGLAESDRAAIAVFKAAGLCENDDYMTTEEAAAVVQLPSFRDLTALIDWDWSALSGMNNNRLFKTFQDCTKLNFSYLPTNLTNNATDISDMFRSCSSLALTSLPDGFGSVATNMSFAFGGMQVGCTSLALTSLPDGFGSVATNMDSVFRLDTSLALTSLPDSFGSVATNMSYLFYNCGKLALTSLPDSFGSVATNMSYLFYNCEKLALTSLPDGFGSRTGANLDSLFLNCTSLALTSLPDGFGSCANLHSVLRGCNHLQFNTIPASFGTATNLENAFWLTNMSGTFNLNNDNFGINATTFNYCFNQTQIVTFEGKFNLSSVNADTLSPNKSLGWFVPTTCTHVMFVANTLKYSLVNSAANLTNIDTESLLSLAECLSSSASGKTWTVTNAQFDTLMSEMYSETLSYIMYVMTKGWNVESA